jgi:predicted transcriptional regulator
MRTAETINTLPEAVRAKLDTLKESFKAVKAIGNEKAVSERKCLILGYIQCLEDMGIVSQSGRRQLNLFYALF